VGEFYGIYGRLNYHPRRSLGGDAVSNLTAPVRNAARKDGCLGLIAGAVCLLLAVCAIPYTIDAYEKGGVLDAAAYGGLMLVLLAMSGGFSWWTISGWFHTEKDCNEIDAQTVEIDNAFYIDDQGNLHHGRLWVNKPDGLYIRNGKTDKLYRRWTPVELEQQRLVNASNWDGWNAAWNDSTMNDGTGQY
jgi:hypothetical protein